MVASFTPEPPSIDADVDAEDGTDLSVEPVDRITVTKSSRARDGTLERIRLRLHVAALEAALARAKRRRAFVEKQYERALQRRESDGTPEFSWRD